MALGSLYLGTANSRNGNGNITTAGVAGSGNSTDLQLLIVGQKPATANGGGVTTPTGWTLIASFTGKGGYGTTTGTDQGNVNCYVFKKDVTTNASQVVTVSDSSAAWAIQMRLASDAGVFDLAYTSGEDSSGDVSLSFAGAANPGISVDDVVLAFQVVASTAATISSPAVSATGVTFGSSLGSTTSLSVLLGNHVNGSICGNKAASGAASAAPVSTATAGGTTTDARGGALILRIREAIVHGTVGKTLAALTSSSAAKALAAAIAGITLAPLTSTAAAIAPVHGASAITLGGVIAAARASALASGALGVTLGPVSSSAAGVSSIAGGLARTVGPVSLSGAAVVWARSPVTRRGIAAGGVRTGKAAGGIRTGFAIGGSRVGLGV